MSSSKDLEAINPEEVYQSTPTETLSKSDMKEAESTGKIPVGKYLCECTGRKFVQCNYMTPACIGLNIEWTIRESVVDTGQSRSIEEIEEFKGRTMDHDIPMFKDGEKKHSKNQRAQCASRLGIVPSTGGDVGPKDWFDGVIGKVTVVNYVEGKKKDPVSGKYEPSGFNQISMFGAFEAPKVSAEDLDVDDI